ISGRFPEKVHAADSLRMVPPTTGSIRIPADAARKMNSEPAEPVAGGIQAPARGAEPTQPAAGARPSSKGSQASEAAAQAAESAASRGAAGSEAVPSHPASAKDSPPKADSPKPAETDTSDVPSEKPGARPETAKAGARSETMQSRPPVMRGLKISEYGDNELDSLSIWLHKTHGIETVDELVAALRQDLGLQRRGARVDTALTNAAKRALK